MTKITVSHYTRGLYNGTNDQTVAWAVLHGVSQICAETTEDQARALAAKEYAKARKPKQLADWNGDTSVETIVSGEGVRA